MNLKEFAYKVKDATPFPGLILAFDPGETTGFCAMQDFKVLELNQIATGPKLTMVECYRNLEMAFNGWAFEPSSTDAVKCEVAIEDYRVYDWKAEDHSWSQVHTIKVVGLLQLLCGQCGTPFKMRMAALAKGFVTDEKLRMWDLYEPTVGQKHARDSLRHACFHAIWPTKEEK